MPLTSYGGGGGGGGPYTLATAIAGSPFAINTPTPPTITSEQVVTTATLGANIVAGRRVILEAGSYGLRTFNANDMEVVLRTGADISYLDFASANRVKVRGETPRTGLISGPIMIQGTSSHICLDGITANGPGTSDDIQVYADNVEMADLIWANNRTYSNGNTTPTLRIMSCNRTLTVDSLIDNIGLSAIYRVHADTADSDNHFCSRNQLLDGFMQLVASGSGGGGAQRLIGVTVHDNDWWGNGSYISLGTGADRPEILTCTNNRGRGLLAWPTEELPAWDVSGNTNDAYEAPPAWDYRTG
jgi:hypothetical protein